MANPYINRELYDAILRFDSSEEAQDHYYRVMDTPTGRMSRSGRAETVRDQILRIYAMLFCDDLEMAPGQPAGPDEVDATADRLYTGSMGFDPQHWYRMQHHFPVIDEDNYDRFAALVISDLSAGPLHEAAVNDGDMLLVGEMDPLHMTPQQRRDQKVNVVRIQEGGDPV
ncbi:MAG: hypothetical protein Q4C02_08765 [Eubacteriales bacterium]|nr:hypothetical protein [Sarcina sp.]MBR2728785.1 hypothetical protein [Lachnospiraceae bacterium]MDO4418350.1 hypothetical protein [Eubacteriales bacterium]